MRVWITVLYWLGAGLSLALCLLYAIGLVLPDTLSQAAAAQKIDSGALRQVVIFVVVYLGLLCLSHVVAAIGLTLGKRWAKPVATVAAALWSLTCVALPVAAVVIFFLWRPLSASSSVAGGRR
ncbi:MAG: hypothetical protein ACR2MZ_11000 [Candidatus Dormibacter sp.]|uniref:hypothetical protein n=1 Tax=Candidatus Dormibacter sp. TaxID=2973982 RepID=UPI0026D3A470